MRKLTWFCVLVLVVAFAAPAYAEVQNIKVSGDITARFLFRDDLDLDGSDDGTTVGAGSDSDDFFMSTVGLNVAADLTDNVSATIRLVNQRDWTANNTDTSDINLDLAYVTLSEMLYAPLTLTIGRQDLWFGKGFIVGSALLAGSVDQDNSISANEYSDLTAFDAIKATLDYNPLTINLVYAKITEGTDVETNDDIDLGGINVGYIFDYKNSEAEAYLFRKQDRSVSPSSYTDTLGLRGSIIPIDSLNLFGEVAYQMGKFQRASDTTNDREAWAVDVGADYTFNTFAWEPNLALEYIYYSGDVTGELRGDYNTWDPMYRGKFDTLIHEFQTTLYATDDANDEAASGNQHQFLVTGTIKPLDSLTASLLYAYFKADEVYVAGRDDEIGSEVDLKLTYDYTQDVQFGLIAGWFIPGDYYQSPNDDTATEVVGTMKVLF